MLFNSYLFIFCFLPITLFSFFYVAKYSHKTSLGVLFLASIIFYAWNDYHYAELLLFSILVNFTVGRCILASTSLDSKKYFLWIGIVFNLSLLGYFKYTNFFIENANTALGVHLPALNIALPIGISFFTFTQIAFLVDSYRGLIQKYQLLTYALFVTYFPHLIAGPIIHHKEVMPQFNKKRTFEFNYRNCSLGIIMFVLGLFKKTVIADWLVSFVGPVFDMHLAHISMIDAWTAALSYTLELYFDFSGYSDMALGLSLLFGVKLPVNFYSPYKAINIIEFWRRWNITLSRFLRDYLYIPLGGNRKGPALRYVNLLVTMLLGGLWHGASWTFVLWGCLHGIYLCINHGWIALKQFFGIPSSNSPLLKILSCLVTFLAVIVAWVFFRAPNFSTAYKILHAMFFEPVILPSFWHIPVFIKTLLLKMHVAFSAESSWTSHESIMVTIVSLMIVWCLPNTYQLLRKYKPALLTYSNNTIPRPHKFMWKPTAKWNLFVLLISLLGIINIQASSIFLYFRF